MNEPLEETDGTENEETEEAEGKKTSLVKQLHQAWVASGEKLPNKKELKALTQSVQDTRQALVALHNSIANAESAASNAARELVAAIGNRPIRIDGQVFDPMSRGDTVFYRSRRTTDNVLDLG